MSDWNPCADPFPTAVRAEDAASVLDRLIEVAPCGDTDREIRRLGMIIDLSAGLNRGDALDVALQAGTTCLANPELSSRQSSLVHYFMSNAWEIKRVSRRSGWEIHAWEQPELEKQIIHLRNAVRLGKSSDLETVRLCQINTNLGNLLNHCGRVVEAVAAWDAALDLDPEFTMALGNRGYGLLSYAQIVPDPGHKILLVQEAHRSTLSALRREKGETDSDALVTFEWVRDEIEASFKSEVLGRAFEFAPKRAWSTKEADYREWVLGHRLFLNDLNDIPIGQVAAADVLMLPPITANLEEIQPSIFGFFNQLKQEFVTARYLLYRGTRSAGVHYSDRDVTLVNTLDYPVYGLRIELVRLSFRTAYSLFDKIAFLLNDYLEMEIPDRQVAFRSIWFPERKPSEGLRPQFGDPKNRGFKGLFWVAKDLHDRRPEFADAIEPDASEIATIRNHIEHKYLKVHDSRPPRRPANGVGFERLPFSVARDDFERRTLRLLQLARAALIYLVQGIYAEEGLSPRASGPSAPMYLDTWDDDWKV